jgi:two-component system OmpR family sensor kinase
MTVKSLLPRSAFPRTLRGRLITGLVSLLAIACASVGIVTYLAVQGALSRELNNDLQTATGLAYNCWEDQGDGTPGSSGTHSTGAQGTAAGTHAGTGLAVEARASSGQDSQLAADKPAPSPSPSPSPGASTAAASDLPTCQGLGERTLVAVVTHDDWDCDLVSVGQLKLTAADKQALLSIPPSPGNEVGRQNIPTTTRFLSYAHGTFELAAIQDPDNDGSVYIIGLPLNSLQDTLRDVAISEGVVFAVVLLLAGVFGFFWVRFSLRPLRRVAVTASQVAELPLESGEVSLPAGVPDTDPGTETGQVGLAFNRMLGHVETALRRRASSEARLRRFAADASHELRTPLAAIRGYAELALLRRGDAPEEVTHALGRVLSESTRMSVLVDDLLLLARLDAGRPLSREPVDMTRLAIDATSDAQVARPGHRWVLELPDDPELVLGDEHRLRQVLANLLSNAGRHTPEGTTVTVRVCDTLPGGGPPGGAGSVVHGTIPPAPRLVISVTDDGPGIPDELLPDLFERFTRADTSRSHATNASSTGLGLAIVDAVVGAHQGAVLMTSRPGRTRFTIVLAQLKAGSPAPAEPTRASRRLLTLRSGHRVGDLGRGRGRGLGLVRAHRGG